MTLHDLWVDPCQHSINQCQHHYTYFSMLHLTAISIVTPVTCLVPYFGGYDEHLLPQT